MKKKFFSNEAGSILVLIGVSLIAILGILTLAIDLGRQEVSSRDLQNAADAAALAAVAKLDGEDTGWRASKRAAVAVLRTFDVLGSEGSLGSGFKLDSGIDDPYEPGGLGETVYGGSQGSSDGLDITIERGVWKRVPGDGLTEEFEFLSLEGDAAAPFVFSNAVRVRVGVIDVEASFGKAIGQDRIPDTYREATAVGDGTAKAIIFPAALPACEALLNTDPNQGDINDPESFYDSVYEPEHLCSRQGIVAESWMLNDNESPRIDGLTHFLTNLPRPKTPFNRPFTSNRQQLCFSSEPTPLPGQEANPVALPNCLSLPAKVIWGLPSSLASSTDWATPVEVVDNLFDPETGEIGIEAAIGDAWRPVANLEINGMPLEGSMLGNETLETLLVQKINISTHTFSSFFHIDDDSQQENINRPRQRERNDCSWCRTCTACDNVPCGGPGLPECMGAEGCNPSGCGTECVACENAPCGGDGPECIGAEGCDPWGCGDPSICVMCDSYPCVGAECDTCSPWGCEGQCECDSGEGVRLTWPVENSAWFPDDVASILLRDKSWRNEYDERPAGWVNPWKDPACSHPDIPGDDPEADFSQARVVKVLIPIIKSATGANYCDWQAHFTGVPGSAETVDPSTEPYVAGFVTAAIYDLRFSDTRPIADKNPLFIEEPRAGLWQEIEDQITGYVGEYYEWRDCERQAALCVECSPNECWLEDPPADACDEWPCQEACDFDCVRPDDPPISPDEWFEDCFDAFQDIPSILDDMEFGALESYVADIEANGITERLGVPFFGKACLPFYNHHTCDDPTDPDCWKVKDREDSWGCGAVRLGFDCKQVPIPYSEKNGEIIPRLVK